MFAAPMNVVRRDVMPASADSCPHTCDVQSGLDSPTYQTCTSMPDLRGRAGGDVYKLPAAVSDLLIANGKNCSKKWDSERRSEGVNRCLTKTLLSFLIEKL